MKLPSGEKGRAAAGVYSWRVGGTGSGDRCTSSTRGAGSPAQGWGCGAGGAVGFGAPTWAAQAQRLPPPSVPQAALGWRELASSPAAPSSGPSRGHSLFLRVTQAAADPILAPETTLRSTSWQPKSLRQTKGHFSSSGQLHPNLGSDCPQAGPAGLAGLRPPGCLTEQLCPLQVRQHLWGGKLRSSRRKGKGGAGSCPISVPRIKPFSLQDPHPTPSS